MLRIQVLYCFSRSALTMVSSQPHSRLWAVEQITSGRALVLPSPRPPCSFASSTGAAAGSTDMEEEEEVATDEVKEVLPAWRTTELNGEGNCCHAALCGITQSARFSRACRCVGCGVW